MDAPPPPAGRAVGLPPLLVPPYAPPGTPALGFPRPPPPGEVAAGCRSPGTRVARRAGEVRGARDAGESGLRSAGLDFSRRGRGRGTVRGARDGPSPDLRRAAG